MLRKFKITIDGKTYLVEMEEIGGAPAAQPAPAAPATPAATPTPATPAAPAPAAPVAPTGEGEVVTAPMPGTVTKILVKDGDTVTENQPLMILEAMKMENEIVAPQDGTVAGVHCNKGDSVNVGDLLVSLN